jgi:hypothetical protein
MLYNSMSNKCWHFFSDQLQFLVVILLFAIAILVPLFCNAAEANDEADVGA